jgi:DNA-binding CsgD family transcriptional regulator
VPSAVLHSRPLPLRTPDWYERNHPVHPGFAWLKDHPGAKLVRVSDVLPLAELKRGDYYREFMEPEGWVHSLGLLFWSEEGLEHMVGINRDEAQGDFDEEDLELARRLYPHIGVALRRVAALRKSAAEQETLAGYLMDLPLPAVCVDWSLKVVYGNRAAREAVARWISADAVGAKPVRKLRLPADIRAACQTLKRQIAAADRTNETNTATRSVQLWLPHPMLPGRVAYLKSLPHAGEPVNKPGFWITWLENDRGAIPHEHLGSWKILSQSERDVARRIGRGETNAEIAQALGRSISTVKTHLDSMFRKLGVKNRAGLYARLNHGDPSG